MIYARLSTGDKADSRRPLPLSMAAGGLLREEGARLGAPSILDLLVNDAIDRSRGRGRGRGRAGPGCPLPALRSTCWDRDPAPSESSARSARFPLGWSPSTGKSSDLTAA